MRNLAALVVASLLFLTGCASIPKEAPELSAQLGARLTAMETAHRHLLASFFNEKRRKIDEFIQQVWVPAYSKNFFELPKNRDIWDQVVASKDPNDRLKYLTAVGPALQAAFNAKRLELMQPFDDLEKEIALKLHDDYAQMHTVNDTLTSFLQSAAKADANRQRLLALAGVSDQKINDAIGQADDFVGQLLQTTQGVEVAVQQAEAQGKTFKSNVEQLLQTLRK